MAITKRKNGYLFSYAGDCYIDVYNDKGEVVRGFIYAPAMAETSPWNFAAGIARWEAGWGTVAEAYRQLSRQNWQPVKPPVRRRRKIVPPVALDAPTAFSER